MPKSEQGEIDEREYNGAFARSQDSLGGMGSWDVAADARPLLPKAAFFMGDLRDGLPMLNMQAAFLISTENFTEKQVGVLFLAFGLSQFLFMAPAGYFLDYSNNKINWVVFSGAATAFLTVMTPFIPTNGGTNIVPMVISNIIQGALTAVFPPGFNGIALGIVGSTGFTHQVSRNRMMNHVGSALFVAVGSLIAYFLYPNIGALFVVSPIAVIGMYWNLSKILPKHVDRDAARCLIIESPTMTEYEQMDTQNSMEEMADETDYIDADEAYSNFQAPNVKLSSKYTPPDSIPENLSAQHPREIGNTIQGSGQFDGPDRSDSKSSDSDTTSRKNYRSGPSFNLGLVDGNAGKMSKVHTPLSVLMDPTLIIFTLVVFFFHLANSSVLPLVMQSLALQDPQAGILLSGLCIIIAQSFMSYFAKIAGDLSPKFGRKGLCTLGLLSLTLRCFLLTVLQTTHEQLDGGEGHLTVKALILSTQLLDSSGAGLFNCLQILITNDISMSTGRFSLMLGVTSGAMCAGATVSGYIGQAIAEDYGYPMAYSCLGIMSLVPVFLFLVAMPETLPDFATPTERQKRLMALWKKVVEQRRKLAIRANPFRRRKRQSLETDDKKETAQTAIHSGELV